ncbi:MAG: tyrosine-protein kinase family protein, partial [bacterium]|nr:tyrosine-protein kinase family protein [bacterium]
MKKEDISSKIEQNLKAAGWDVVEDGLRVLPDPFTGWLIVIISPDFEDKTRKERKKVALAGLDDLQIEWLELLTPQEKEWAGSLPIDTDGLDLPLWPEALAKGALFDPSKTPIHFLSDIDEDIDPPIITTFYSLRGGVGRSTTMAYTAWLLASKGLKVICVDMDFEAPGITSLFGRDMDVAEGTGLVHLLMEIDQGGDSLDITKHLLRISESYDLYCLPAGKPSANYARLLRFIHPESWYREERNPLRELLDQLKTNLPFTPDVILLDARTGITQLSGPLMFDLSDISIIVFFPHPQAKTGTEVLVKALLAAKTRREINGQAISPEIRFLVSPIPSGNIHEIKRYKNRAYEWIADWISPIEHSIPASKDILASDITHLIPYKEVIATSDQIMKEDDVWNDFRPVADWIEGFLTVPGEKTVIGNLADKKNDILGNFNFSTGSAETQQDLRETFVETDVVKKALSPAIPLVLGRKGTGKTSIFRRLSEDDPSMSFIIT